MDCLLVKIYFVNTCEVNTFTINEPIRSPYATLQRILMARGVESFSAAWSDEYNNFFPLKSDRSFADAVNARHHPLQPLRIFVKDTRRAGQQSQEGHFRPHGFSASFPGGRPPAGRRDDGASSMGPWNGHKLVGPKERISEIGGRKMYYDGPQEQRHHEQQQHRPNYQPHSRQDMRDVPRLPHPTTSNSVGRAPLMPKDPTLAELVDKVRQSLDMVASMHSSQNVEKDSEDVIAKQPSLALADKDPACSRAEEASAGASPTFVVVAPAADKAGSNDSVVAGVCLSELLDEVAAEEEQALQLRGVPHPRAESVMSDGDDFMVVTPGSDSCVNFCLVDFEAAFSDLDSEDTFEIVDCPDGDWDSDIEWKEVESVVN
ncbi:hypothetical protein BV898_11673 [Hypsibius exemplaris]|uniref:Uncharacterized protein n=1 Tax=Hypsibius exemplaris TaxID=2072580 RepID=A0A1W0WFZ2_HYPEX|nr:hypothetical protein BV898_11673 [Hypsibius exemplaris]